MNYCDIESGLELKNKMRGGARDAKGNNGKRRRYDGQKEPLKRQENIERAR